MTDNLFKLSRIFQSRQQIYTEVF